MNNPVQVGEPCENCIAVRCHLGGMYHSHINDLLLQSEIHYSPGISLMADIRLRWDVSPHISNLLLRKQCDDPKCLNFKRYIRNFSQVKTVVEKISKFLDAFYGTCQISIIKLFTTIVNSQKQSVIKVISMRYVSRCLK